MTKAELENLTILNYPDPCLRKVCEPVTQFDDALRALTERMFQLMHEAKGVGLAGPQVGVLRRFFIMNATQEPKDDLVLINPEPHDPHGYKQDEEGCLSLPEIHVQVRRALSISIRFQTLTGEPRELHSEDLLARIWQHETDHLDGKLILDRMGPSDRIATRKQLKELERQYETRTRK